MNFCPYCNAKVDTSDSDSAWSEEDEWYHVSCLEQELKDQDEDHRLDDPRHEVKT